MTASGPSPRNHIETHPDDRSERYDDPFWTDERRAVFWDVVRRVAVAALLALLAAGWLILVFIWMLNLALTERSGPPAVVLLAMFLPTFALFALSVARLVERRAPPLLRILGVIYAILGTVVILSILD